MPPRLTYKLNPYEQTTCPVQRVRIDVKLPRPAFKTVRSCINIDGLTRLWHLDAYGGKALLLLGPFV